MIPQPRQSSEDVPRPKGSPAPAGAARTTAAENATAAKDRKEFLFDILSYSIEVWRMGGFLDRHGIRLFQISESSIVFV